MTTESGSGSFRDFVLRFKLELFLITYLAGCVLSFVYEFVFSIPQFQSIFMSMNVELPAVTKLLLSLSSALASWAFLAVPLVLLLVIGAGAALVRLLYSSSRAEAPSALEAYAFVPLGLAVVLVEALRYLVELSIYMPMLKLVSFAG